MKHIDLRKFGGIKMKVQGLVTEIYEGEIGKGKSKGEPFFTISLDNDDKLYLYTKENYEWIEKVEEGKTYEFEVTRLRNYLTVSGLAVEIAPSEVTAPSPQAKTGSAPATERYYKNNAIALSNTVEYTKDDATMTKEQFEETFHWFINLVEKRGEDGLEVKED